MALLTVRVAIIVFQTNRAVRIIINNPFGLEVRPILPSQISAFPIRVCGFRQGFFSKSSSTIGALGGYMEFLYYK